jgi:very-short-patch-repair endonuclease
MRPNQRHNLSQLGNNRRALRNSLTPAEAALWTLLKNGQLQGRKFRRQHSVENYIADFYCLSEKLIIELDGEVHNNYAQAEKDMRRDERLMTLGFKVLRFENRMVFDRTEDVLLAIVGAFAGGA